MSKPLRAASLVKIIHSLQSSNKAMSGNLPHTSNSTDLVFQKYVYNAGKTYIDLPITLGELDSLAPDTYVYDIAIINRNTQKITTLIWSAYFMIKGVAHNVD